MFQKSLHPLLLLVSAMVSWLAPSHAQAFGGGRGDRYVLCPAFVLSKEIELTDSEKRLVCGSPPGDRSQSDAWEKIPYAQAQYNLKNFLQDRGYHRPVFTRDGIAPGQSLVEIGDPTWVTSLEADGAPESLDLGRKRKIVGEPLTPKLLGEVEKWVFNELQSQGYACPVIKTQGDPKSGEILVGVEPGSLLPLGRIVEEEIPGLERGVIRRHDAFRLGRTFNGNWMEVANRRVVADDVVESSHYSYKCEPGGVTATQQVVPGLPRLLLFGVGINTEGVLLGKASWKNARLGRMGSSTQVLLLGSSKLQRLETRANWYLLDEPSRYYLRPLAELKHQNEEFFESVSTRFEVSPAGTWDNQELHADFHLGPVFEAIRTLRGAGVATRDTHFLSLGGMATLKSHDYEFYQNSPRTGFQVSAEAYANDEVFLSDADAKRVELHGSYLWNVRDYDPHLLVLGLRGGAGTILTQDRPGPGNRLPATFMHFLGGSSDLRGFALNELPGPDGALSFAFVNFEARLGGILPLGIEPFAFLDVGRTGATPVSLDSPYFRSPGLGLRWESPIGVVRTTLARGYPEIPETPGIEDSGAGGYNFYLKLGEEF